MTDALQPFIDQCIESGLVSAEELAQFQKSLPEDCKLEGPEDLARELVRAGKVTKYQATALYQGKGKNLVVGDYVIQDKIGSGGMGQVYKARHQSMKRLVALKLLPPALSKNQNAIKRFEREVEAAAKLSHPNVAAALDAGHVRGTYFLVMEFVEGRDLAEILKERGPLPVDEVVGYILQAARGLGYAHGEGVIHRDIKPANILVANNGVVKILDMGLARLDDGAADEQLTNTGQVMGTMDYMAPEQAADSHDADARSDIYSLGCTLYRLLTGDNVYSENTPVKKVLAHLNNPIPHLTEKRPDVPESLDAIFLKMVAKHPAYRYQSCTELCDALEACQIAVTDLSLLNLDLQASISGFTNFTEELQTPAIVPNLPVALSPVVSIFPPTATPLVTARRLTEEVDTDATSPVTNPSWPSNPLTRPYRMDSRSKSPVTDASPPDLDQFWEYVKRVPPATWAGVGGAVAVLMLFIGTLMQSTGNVDVRADKDEESQKTAVVKKTPKVSKPKNGWQGWPKDAPPPAIAPFDAKQAKAHQEVWAAYLKVPVEYTNTIGMKFVLIPPGEFTMGSTSSEIEEALKVIDPNDKGWQACIKSEAPRHKVILSKPIYVGVYEVTQKEFAAVMGKNTSHFAPQGAGRVAVAGIDTTNHPVEMVNWNDAAEFCAKLSQREQLKPFYFRDGATVTLLNGAGYRLPTEAEWENACRAGTTTRYWIGDKPEELLRAGWFGDNSGPRTHAVGELKANPFGLYDTHGNIWEWVQDWWEPSYYGQFLERPALDPTGPTIAGSKRLLRGGRWYYAGQVCGASARFDYDPAYATDGVGFRVALMLDAVKQAVKAHGQKNRKSNKQLQGSPKGAPPTATAPFDATKAKEHQNAWAKYLGVPIEHTNSIGMKLRLIPPGEFIMGSTPAEIEEALKRTEAFKDWQDCVRSEGPQHKVTITKPIYLGVHELTQGQYLKVMAKNPSNFASTGASKEAIVGMDTTSHPVENVSWNDAAEFCAKLSQQESLKPVYFRVGETVTLITGTGYRLPTEAEWEFACRAGTTTKYWIGDKEEELPKVAWFGTNSGGRTHPVGELKLNPFGLYDIHGNVWELVQDSWELDYYRQILDTTAIDPSGPLIAGPRRVWRGGQWRLNASYTRSSSRHAANATFRGDCLGFRVAMPVEVVKRTTK